MSDSQITKRALADSMKELMEKHSMKSISISDIVDGCNLNRQSFYYHFKDKYDLVNWIYYTEFIISIKGLQPTWELLEKIISYFYDNKVFYKNAFEVKGQNSFSEYFNDVLHSILAAHLAEIFKNKKNVEFYATFYADAIRVAISRWLLEGAKLSPEQFVILMKNAIEIVAAHLLED